MVEGPAPSSTELDPEQACAVCGRAREPDQQYCLECGSRIVRRRPAFHVLGSAWQRRLGRYPGDWVWGSFLALAIAAAGTAIAILFLGNGKKGSRETIVATTTIVHAIPQQPAPPSPGPRPRPRGRPAPKPPPGTLVAWPDTNGFTVVLASLPVSGGLEAAKAKAKRAVRAGLPKVGIIVSSGYASLHPGYYVIFSGVYSSLDEAQTAASAAESRFPNAYARQIAR